MARTERVACLIVGTLAGLCGQGTREIVSAMKVSKPSDRTMVLTRTFNAPQQKVFDALTKAEQVTRWFQPKQMSLESYEADLRIGGSSHYVFRRQSDRAR